MKFLLIPAAKIILLGLLKTVFLLIGALFFPAFTLRFIVNGAVGIIRPLANWLQNSQHLDNDLLQRLDDDLSSLQSHSLNRTESRAVLMTLIKETIYGVKSSITGLASSWATAIRKLFAKLK